MDGTRAAAEAARRKVKRAEGLLRDAARDLASLAGDDNVLGVLRVHDAQTIESAAELIELGAGHHGAVDVVVIARPQRRARSTPTTGPDGPKETPNDTTHKVSHG